MVQQGQWMAAGTRIPRNHVNDSYGPVDESVIGMVTGKEVIKVLLLAGVVGWVVGFIASIFAAVATQSSPVGFMAFLVFGFIGWAATLFLSYKFPAGEWYVLIDGGAEASPLAYSYVEAAIRRREPPLVARPVTKALGVSDGGGQGQFLEIEQGRFRAYVSVFPYGNGLFIGWTMWRSEIGWTLILAWLSHLFDSLTRKGSLFHYSLRANPVKAMRELVHAATFEGLDAALQVTKEEPSAVGGTIGGDAIPESGWYGPGAKSQATAAPVAPAPPVVPAPAPPAAAPTPPAAPPAPEAPTVAVPALGAAGPAGRACSNGHPMADDAKFCELCGSPAA